MTVANLPPFNIKCGQVFRALITLTDSALDPINLSTGWTGKFSVATSYIADAALSVAPSGMTSAGVVTISLTAAQSYTLQSLAGEQCLVFQVDLDKDDGSDAHRMQGKVNLWPEIVV